MDEYINREDALKCLEYNTIQKPSANDVVSATLRVAREKVKKLPVAQEGALLSFWRDPDKDPPKVETEVLILYRNEIDGYGITTAHYEDGNVFLQDSEYAPYGRRKKPCRMLQGDEAGCKDVSLLSEHPGQWVSDPVPRSCL